MDRVHRKGGSSTVCEMMRESVNQGKKAAVEIFWTCSMKTFKEYKERNSAQYIMGKVRQGKVKDEIVRQHQE